MPRARAVVPSSCDGYVIPRPSHLFLFIFPPVSFHLSTSFFSSFHLFLLIFTSLFSSFRLFLLIVLPRSFQLLTSFFSSIRLALFFIFLPLSFHLSTIFFYPRLSFYLFTFIFSSFRLVLFIVSPFSFQISTSFFSILYLYLFTLFILFSSCLYLPSFLLLLLAGCSSLSLPPPLNHRVLPCLALSVCSPLLPTFPFSPPPCSRASSFSPSLPPSAPPLSVLACLPRSHSSLSPNPLTLSLLPLFVFKKVSTKFPWAGHSVSAVEGRLRQNPTLEGERLPLRPSSRAR
mmetsp:Transcript_40486/g.88851  ORF Transcript_40486/g.88851 Transcript_40486/m.88851 type:complete len:288 (+) Transcript_40486:357-1220(+)